LSAADAMGSLLRNASPALEVKGRLLRPIWISADFAIAVGQRTEFLISQVSLSMVRMSALEAEEPMPEVIEPPLKSGLGGSLTGLVQHWSSRRRSCTGLAGSRDSQSRLKTSPL